MFKLIVFAIIFYVIYRAAIKKRIVVRPGKVPDFRRASEQLADEMVQDPICKTYFPRNQGVVFDHQDETLLFCSQECLDKFKAEIDATWNDSTDRRS